MPGLKLKGKVLMGLKSYPALSLKRTFYQWYLKTTGRGENLLRKTCNQIVLYTNITKSSSFYRIMATVRKGRVHVHPRIKRMTTMIHLYTRIFFDRSKK